MADQAKSSYLSGKARTQKIAIVKAVSYTHLDVYKRQVQWNA